LVGAARGEARAWKRRREKANRKDFQNKKDNLNNVRSIGSTLFIVQFIQPTFR